MNFKRGWKDIYNTCDPNVEFQLAIIGETGGGGGMEAWKIFLVANQIMKSREQITVDYGKCEQM